MGGFRRVAYAVRVRSVYTVRANAARCVERVEVERAGVSVCECVEPCVQLMLYTESCVPLASAEARAGGGGWADADGARREHHTPRGLG